MKRLFLTAGLLCSLMSLDCFAEKVVWTGEVHSDGTPSATINLNLDKKYQFIVSGTINLGKWVEAGVPMGEDAFFEFDGPNGPERQPAFKNSINVSLEDKTYQPSHTYKSMPFVAKNSKVHFWVDDKDYSDNKGSLQVKVVLVD